MYSVSKTSLAHEGTDHFSSLSFIQGLVLSSLSEKEGLLEQQRHELMREKEVWHGRLSQARDRERELVEVSAKWRENVYNVLKL